MRLMDRIRLGTLSLLALTALGADDPEPRPEPNPPADAQTAFAVMPEAVNSLGVAVLGDHLYVYSGHNGRTHFYHTGTTSKHFRRLDLRDRTTWEELPVGPDVQGSALLAHGDKLYQIGGMQARNERGRPSDLRSIDRFAQYDPQTETWTELDPLPEPRSTFDAAVLGDMIYVFGGWTLEGDSTVAPWSFEALRIDLSDDEPRWESFEQPFVRRALAVAAARGKLFVLGGLMEEGGVSSQVDIYDPEADAWSRGPDLPPGNQFAPSAFGIGDGLYVNGRDGNVYRLDDDGQAWEAIARLGMPRITHRLVPGIEDDLLIVGGNFTGVPVSLIESVPTAGRSRDRIETITWAATFDGRAKHSQALALDRGRLIAAGGTQSRVAHAFLPDDYLREVVAFPIGATDAETLGSLATPIQSAVAVAVPEGRRNTLYVLGGITFDGDTSRSLGIVQRFDARNDAWVQLEGVLPDDRAMFEATAHDGKIYVFGGSSFDVEGDQGEDIKETVLVFDPEQPEADAVTLDATIPTPRRSFGSARLEDKFYLVNGLAGGFAIADDMDIFDFNTGTFTTVDGPERPRLFPSMVAHDGKLYLVAGFARAEGGGFERVDTIEVYDPEADAWTTLDQEVPIPSTYPAAFSVNGRLLFYGTDPRDEGVARFAIMAP